MKSTKIIYWIFTCILAGFIGFSSIPDILCTPDAVRIVCTQLHYPEYFLRFIGIAKLLGAIAILIPGFPRIKEWAYAGIAYDLLAATYSMNAIGAPVSGLLFMAGFLALFAVSYIYSHKMQQFAKTA